MPAKAEPTRPASSQLAIRLNAYLGARQDALVDRSIAIAKSHGYAPFTTTIRAAWVEAITSVTEAVGQYITSASDRPSGPKATQDYAKDPRFDQMRRISRIHRSMGITMQMYIGLFKHFRNIYLDAMDGFDCGSKAPELRAMLCDFFDEAELSISADWTDSTGNQRLRELQQRTRSLTLDKDRYFAIFESLRNPAFLLDHQKQLVNANQAAAELFLGDVQAGDIIYLRSMRRRKLTLQKTLDQVLVVASEPNQTIWLDTLAGHRCFDVRMRGLHDAVENIAVGHVLLLNDVTAHQNAIQQAQHAERQMSRFLATMSHEIRTPLHSVLGATELLRSVDHESHGNYLDVIESAGQSLLQTLNNVLDYSKLENSPPIPRRVATDLRRVTEAFKRVVAVGTRGQEPQVSTVIAETVPPLVGIDWAMTRQVLTNLVSNAIRYDGGRGVEILITMAARGTLRFEVRDHGPGVSAANVMALSRPFSQIDPRDTGNGGAGLGLAISHHLVDAMGGRIGCRNLGEGALFWFDLPLASDLAQPGAVQSVCPALQHRDVDQRCLLVDDDPAGSLVTTRQLELLGFSVEHADTVASARQRAATHVYDVFVIDYLLPDGDGPSLAKHLRTLHPHARTVAFTANIEAVKGSAAANDAFDAVLAKPADLAALSDTLQRPKTGPAVLPAQISSPVKELAPETANAMVDAFAQQWADFRHDFLSADARPTMSALGHAAHRLAGSSSLLGIHELEPLLRVVEEKCAADVVWPEIQPLLVDLNIDLWNLASWREIGRPGPRPANS